MTAEIARPRLVDRMVIVTGGGRGMGRAIVQSCLDEGAYVVSIDLDHSSPHSHQRLVTLTEDITDSRVIDAAVGSAKETAGAIDALVNVAGVRGEGSVTDTTLAEWRRTLDVNLTAPFMWSRAILPTMVAQGRGAIVNVTSVAALRAAFASAGYVASKTALLGLTRSIAVDYGRSGVRCNALAPGAIDSPMLHEFESAHPGATQRNIDAGYAGRLGTAEEIAACCVFLISDDAAFINGAHLPVDAARTAGP